MLFDLSNIKISGTSQYFSVGTQPEKVFPYERKRIVVVLYEDVTLSAYLLFGRTRSAVPSSGITYAGYYLPLEIYGPEEIWIAGTSGTAWIAAGGMYQAIYRDD